MLTSIELTGFRGFQHLELDGLKRVNIIVGKNNSGKTSLLEAINRLGNDSRKESRSLRYPESTHGKDWLVNDAYSPDTVSLNAMYSGNEIQIGVNDNPFLLRSHFQLVTISVYSTPPNEIVTMLGNAIKRRGVEEIIETTLRRVDERIQKVRVIPSSNGNQISVDIGLSELVPVSVVGQGVFRLLEIYSAVLGTGAKVCLVDEIENGIHHSSLIDLWRSLSDASERFNFQLFATTHSHECIEAAHEAFSERSSYDLSVIQLFRKTVSVQGRVLDQAQIAAAIAGDIDLRG